jgi:hypothetical protein
MEVSKWETRFLRLAGTVSIQATEVFVITLTRISVRPCNRWVLDNHTLIGDTIAEKDLPL